MCCKYQLCIAPVNFRIMDQANEKADHKGMQARIQFINKKDAALCEDIQQRTCKGKKLLSASGFVGNIK